MAELVSTNHNIEANILETNFEIQKTISSPLNESIPMDTDFKKSNDQSEDNLNVSIIDEGQSELMPVEHNIGSPPEVNSINEESLKAALTTRKKRLAVIDSESENEEQSEIGSEIFNNEAPIYTTNFKGELMLEKPNKSLANENRWAALCDSESSEDEITKETGEILTNDMHEENVMYENDVARPKSYRRKNKPKSAKNEPKKMTGKEALKLRKEIQSEAQRMLRETRVSLPYHKPKQFTLKEFLSKRPKLSSASTLTARMHPSVAIKMPREQLEVITKKLEEREKEVKEFYKSDSGSDDDEGDSEYLPEQELIEENITNQENDDEVPENNENVEKGSNGNEKTENNDVEFGSNGTEISAKGNGSFDSGTDRIGDNIAEIQYEGLDKVMCKELEHTELINLLKETEQCHDVAELDSGIQSGEIFNKEDFRELISNDTDSNEESDEAKGSNGIGLLEIEKQSEESVRLPDEDSNEESDEAKSSKSIGLQEIEKQSKESVRLSDDYEFNLDDLEESETTRVSSTFNQSHPPIAENLIIDESNPEVNENMNDLSNHNTIDALKSNVLVNEKDLTISELLKQKLASIQPKLNGAPDDVIDLETGITKPKEIVTLMKRFEKHTAKNHIHKNKVHLNVVSVLSQGNIEKEVVSMEIDDEDTREVDEKPGAKLQRLRNELQDQIAKRKSQIWQNKSLKLEDNPGDEEENNEYPKSHYEADVDDFLDDEDEEEMSESSDEDIVEAEDVEAMRRKCAFIEEEAEDSDIDDENNANDDENNANDDENNEANDDSDKENEYFEGANSESTNSSAKEQVIESVRKPLRRILKGFTEDSDEDDEIVRTKLFNEKEVTKKLNEDDDVIPPHQIKNNHTPNKETSQQTQNGFDYNFLTPVSYITGIKNLTNSLAKSFRLPNQPNIPSPLKESDWQFSLQKKLFTDTELPDTQVMADICYDEPVTQSVVEMEENKGEIKQRGEEMKQGAEDNNSPINSDQFSSTIPSTLDMLNVCSGNFTGTIGTSISCEEKEISSQLNNEETLRSNENNTRRSSDLDHDVIISQLLDEDEMEQFKKKFDSPGTSNTEKESGQLTEELEEEVTASGIIYSDDDDDGDEVNGMTVKRRKNKSKLAFSDDSSGESDVEKEESIDLHDEDDEDENDEIQEPPPPDNVDYDSEENEIELEEDGGEGINGLKQSDFFDNEAELSESEWGSADEDENDLDTLEIEAGDTENFDEKKLKSDLERIHMRRMLDEDQREVKLLQELLLDDGELHGSGRARQFKWKHIDSLDGEEASKTEDDVYLDEEESEEQWRKKRYEREMFLKEKQKMNVDRDLLSYSQILKIGEKVLKRSTISSNASLSNTPNDNEEEIVVKTVKSSLILQNKRGSFLSRGEQVLQRLAEFNKVTDTVVTGATAKKSKNFLFQTVSVERNSSSSLIQDKKRKAVDGTPKIIKKLRLCDNWSPSNKPKAKAKLF